MSPKKKKSKSPASKSQAQTALCRLSYATEDEFVKKHAPNVSKTGIFIGTSKPKTVGNQLRFELQLNDGTSLLKGKGEVTWNRMDSPSGAPPGMGVKYLQLNEHGKTLIKKVMAYKATHGDKFDKPSRYSMVPMPPQGAAVEPVKPEAPLPEGRQKKRKMKKIDLNEIDSLLDGIAISKVSTKKRVRYRRPSKAAPPPPPPEDMTPREPSMAPSADVAPPSSPSPSVPVPSPQTYGAAESFTAPTNTGSPDNAAPALLFDADEFPSDTPGTAGVASAVPSNFSDAESLIVEESDEIQIERISQEEISSIADVEDLEPNMEIEAELLEPDVDSEPPQPRDSVDLSDDDLAGVLEDVYSNDPAETSDEMIQEDELDALLNALEDDDDEEEVEDLEELDVIEIDEDY